MKTSLTLTLDILELMINRKKRPISFFTLFKGGLTKKLGSSNLQEKNLKNLDFKNSFFEMLKT